MVQDVNLVLRRLFDTLFTPELLALHATIGILFAMLLGWIFWTDNRETLTEIRARQRVRRTPAG